MEDKETLDKIREICGCVEDGTYKTIYLYKHNVFNLWYFNVGVIDDKPRIYIGETLEEAVNIAYKMEQQ